MENHQEGNKNSKQLDLNGLLTIAKGSSLFPLLSLDVKFLCIPLEVHY